jgi:hypothetical protein
MQQALLKGATERVVADKLSYRKLSCLQIFEWTKIGEDMIFL